ncbi:trehalase [Pilobolus umbonatus]|nr:trehalase [Pilobolus umbonatus]
MKLILLLFTYLVIANCIIFEECLSPIYCEGPLLKTVQLAKLFNDSKTFVDMPTSRPVNEVLAAFEQIGGAGASRDAIQQFVSENFLPAGTELVPMSNQEDLPVTWTQSIQDLKYRGWIQQLIRDWKNLTFRFDTSNLCEGCISSTLPVKRPFVVPGGRFREFYYWDTYFVIKGLLLSNKVELALDMIGNLFDFVEEYGFVPNGARIYYLNRSQPPFLTLMVKEYYDKTRDTNFMIRAIPILEKEYEYWMQTSLVEVEDKQGYRHKLNRYTTNNKHPRPESYIEDYNTTQNTSNPELIYADIAAAAESGWDFSTRWTTLKKPLEGQVESYEILRSIRTHEIIPIDLNALLWYMENFLSRWSTSKKWYYKRRASKRLRAIEALLWHEEDYSYYDFNLSTYSVTREFTPANLFPIWLGASSSHNSTHLFDTTQRVLDAFPGILTTSFFNSSMQWDYPNGWPPLNYIAIQAMRRYSYPGAKDLADRYVRSAFCGWYRTGGSIPGILNKLDTPDNGHMFEKYDVNDVGASGGLGEYVSQVGFGWTNGVALWILSEYPYLLATNC